MLFPSQSWSVLGKTVPSVLCTAFGLRSRVVSKTSGTDFPIRTSRIYLLHSFEISCDPCNQIGSQQYVLLTNRTMFSYHFKCISWHQKGLENHASVRAGYCAFWSPPPKISLLATKKSHNTRLSDKNNLLIYTFAVDRNFFFLQFMGCV